MKIIINKKDLHRDTFHCGGKGGQNVNKVETGVRWTYLPLNLSAKSCQERTQGQNERIALQILLGKIYKYYNEKEVERKEAATFGSKIRSYFMHGSRRIIDHRSDKVYTNVDEIINGQIDELLKDSK